jgi:hypothetical protein
MSDVNLVGQLCEQVEAFAGGDAERWRYLAEKHDLLRRALAQAIRQAADAALDAPLDECRSLLEGAAGVVQVLGYEFYPDLGVDTDRLHRNACELIGSALRARAAVREAGEGAAGRLRETLSGGALEWALSWLERTSAPDGGVILPVAGYSGKVGGFLARLHLTRLGGGEAVLVEHPAMALRPLGPTLLETMRAVAGALPAPVCWRLSTEDVRSAEMPLDGDSLGGAAAVAFALLRTGGLADRDCVVVAKVAGDRLDSVGHEKEKLWEAARRGLKRAVVAEDAALSQADLDDLKAAGLEVVMRGTVAEAVEVCSSLANGLRNYLRSLLDLPEREKPAFLGRRRLTDLYVWPDVLREESADEKQRRSSAAGTGEEEKVRRLSRDADYRKCLSWQDELRGVRRAVILGLPGEGKTTLARMSVRHLAQQALADLGTGRVSVSDVSVPICLRLAHVAEYGLEGAARQALEGLHAEVVRHLIAGLRGERSWLFLDAFDEVPETARLRLALGSLREARCRVVVTSRPSGYERAHLPFESLVEYELAALTPRQTRDFVRGWFPDCEERASATLSLVQGNPAMDDLASNGLLLTLTCFTAERHALDPEDTRRVDVYRLVARDVVRGAWRDDAIPENHPRVTSLLRLCRRLAWKLFKSAPERSVFADDEVCDAIERVSGSRSIDWVEEVISQLRTVGLLVSPGVNQVMFLHRTFLEYFAAERVATLRDPIKAVERCLWRSHKSPVGDEMADSELLPERLALEEGMPYLPWDRADYEACCENNSPQWCEEILREAEELEDQGKAREFEDWIETEDFEEQSPAEEMICLLAGAMSDATKMLKWLLMRGSRLVASHRMLLLVGKCLADGARFD